MSTSDHRPVIAPAALLERPNRGLLLDLVVLVANVLAMGPLSDALVGVVRRASNDDPGAMRIIFGVALALGVLAPLGATLKRWHYHERKRESGEGGRVKWDGAVGCLFNPIFYFCLVVVIFSAASAFILQSVYGNRGPGGGVFAVSLFGGLALMLTHTWLVYRYFTPPERPPRAAFLRSPASELLGDACLFANMLVFMTIWNAISFAGIGPPGGVVEAVLRLGVFLFLALLLYFPPRMFYLAEDIGRRGTWLWMLAANAPVVWRLMGG